MQILELVNKNVQIDVIALQEVWEIRDPLSLIIPGFQPLVCKTRTNMRGGGIGFYVKEGINGVSHQWCDLFHRLLHSYTRHTERGSRGERDIIPSTQDFRPRICSLRQTRVSG